MNKRKKILSLFLILIMTVSFSACKSADVGSASGLVSYEGSGEDAGSDADTSQNSSSYTEESLNSNEATDKTQIDIEIGATVLTATLADNPSAKAFAALLEQGEITVEMHDYGSFEKVGSLPQSIVQSDENITTEPGDIILYQGSEITIYYDTNTYDFTRLGKIEGVSQEELKSLLGAGSVSAVFRLHGKEADKVKVLIAYFSATGTTKKIAEYAAEATGADIYEIEPEQPYSSEDLNYNNSGCRANEEMNDPQCRPEISGSISNMADYDIVFIGYPIWWGEEPRIVSTFIESYDFSGKSVVSFSTSGSSGHNDKNIKELAPGAEWITGERMSGASTKDDVAGWIESLGLGIAVQ